MGGPKKLTSNLPYHNFGVIPMIRIVTGDGVRARRSWPWLGFVESGKEIGDEKNKN